MPSQNRSTLSDRGEMTMKLKLLFIVMDLLTILAYPIVFVYDKLRRFSKIKVSVARDNLPVTTGR